MISQQAPALSELLQFIISVSSKPFTRLLETEILDLPLQTKQYILPSIGNASVKIPLMNDRITADDYYDSDNDDSESVLSTPDSLSDWDILHPSEAPNLNEVCQEKPNPVFRRPSHGTEWYGEQSLELNDQDGLLCKPPVSEYGGSCEDDDEEEDMGFLHVDQDAGWVSVSDDILVDFEKSRERDENGNGGFGGWFAATWFK